MSENWLPIAGFGDCYAISDFGRVMRVKPRSMAWRGPKPAKSRAKPFAPSLCRAFVNRGGYPQVRIGPVGAQRTVSVHRLVAIAFVPNPLGLRVVNHMDGCKTNNSPSNLEWTTHQENARHSIAMGLQKVTFGSGNPVAKLTESDIIKIRADTRIQRLIAADFAVDPSLISMIKLRKIWTHVPG